MPAWVGPDGYPRSWRHYVYGMSYLTRARARALLDTAEASRAAGAVSDDFERWRDDRRSQAERSN